MFKPETLEAYKAILAAKSAEFVSQDGNQKLTARLKCGHTKTLATSQIMQHENFDVCKTCQAQARVSHLETQIAELKTLATRD